MIDALLFNKYHPQSLQEESLSSQIGIEAEDEGGNSESDVDNYLIEGQEETDLNSN